MNTERLKSNRVNNRLAAPVNSTRPGVSEKQKTAVFMLWEGYQVQEVAACVGVHRSTIWRWFQRKEIQEYQRKEINRRSRAMVNEAIRQDEVRKRAMQLNRAQKSRPYGGK